MPPSDALHLLEIAGDMTLLVKTMQRALPPMHWAWQWTEEEALANFRKEEGIYEKAASMSASLDGIMIPKVMEPIRQGDSRGLAPRQRQNCQNALTTKLSFLRKRRRHLPYFELGQRNLVVGSGQFEVEYKSTVTLRMKRPGHRVNSVASAALPL